MAAIHKAVIHDRPECVQELMEARADPNVVYMGIINLRQEKNLLN